MGRRVAELRRDRGQTQDAFAEILSVSVKYVQRVEAGTENLGLRTLARLAKGLKIDVADLLSPPTTEGPRRGRPSRKAYPALYEGQGEPKPKKAAKTAKAPKTKRAAKPKKKK